KRMSATIGADLRAGHERMTETLDRLREIADQLDNANPPDAAKLIIEADEMIAKQIVEHEREDENAVYPRVAEFLGDRHGLGAMSRAHREIIHLARLLRRLVEALSREEADRYAIRDGQHMIESIESLVRLHNAQEEDIYEHAVGA
ncbi:MAG TPA: hemerythrin domain-containing protein, partial [Roseiarcus sp.]|nr:hemerythrin domain-containing protein [Roseiarcus sp.]